MEWNGLVAGHEQGNDPVTGNADLELFRGRRSGGNRRHLGTDLLVDFAEFLLFDIERGLSNWAV